MNKPIKDVSVDLVTPIIEVIIAELYKEQKNMSPFNSRPDIITIISKTKNVLTLVFEKIKNDRTFCYKIFATFLLKFNNTA